MCFSIVISTNFAKKSWKFSPKSRTHKIGGQKERDEVLGQWKKGG